DIHTASEQSRENTPIPLKQQISAHSKRTEKSLQALTLLPEKTVVDQIHRFFKRLQITEVDDTDTKRNETYATPGYPRIELKVAACTHNRYLPSPIACCEPHKFVFLNSCLGPIKHP